MKKLFCQFLSNTFMGPLNRRYLVYKWSPEVNAQLQKNADEVILTVQKEALHFGDELAEISRDDDKLAHTDIAGLVNDVKHNIGRYVADRASNLEMGTSLEGKRLTAKVFTTYKNQINSAKEGVFKQIDSTQERYEKNKATIVAIVEKAGEGIRLNDVVYERIDDGNKTIDAFLKLEHPTSEQIDKAKTDAYVMDGNLVLNNDAATRLEELSAEFTKPPFNAFDFAITQSKKIKIISDDMKTDNQNFARRLDSLHNFLSSS